MVTVFNVLNFTIIFFVTAEGLTNGAIRLVFCEFGIIIAWVLSREGHIQASSIVFLTTIYLAFLIYPFSFFWETKSAEDVFLTLFIFIALNSIVLVFYDLRHESVKIVLWLALFFITFFVVFFYSLNNLNRERYGAVKITFDSQPVLLYGYISACVFLLVVIAVFKMNNQRNKHFLELKNQLLTEQKEISSNQKLTLEKKQQELITVRDQLSSLNESLERRVQQRRNELEAAREKLVKYGFINEELDRTVSELTDYIDQMSFEDSEVAKLNSIVNELDNLIRKINSAISNVESEIA